MSTKISVLTLQTERPGGVISTAAPSSVLHSQRVLARDLRPGDIVQQCDWTLHVCEVRVGQAAVDVAVTEFGFPLHYAADAQIHLAA